MYNLKKYTDVINFEYNEYTLQLVYENNRHYIVQHNDDGSFWYFNGRLHRENGPAAIYNNGTKIWYNNGLFHREDGPAVEGKKYKYWFLYGLPNYNEFGVYKEYIENNIIIKEYIVQSPDQIVDNNFHCWLPVCNLKIEKVNYLWPNLDIKYNGFENKKIIESFVKFIWTNNTNSIYLYKCINCNLFFKFDIYKNKEYNLNYNEFTYMLFDNDRFVYTKQYKTCFEYMAKNILE